MMAGLRKKRVPVYPSVCCCSLIGLAVNFHPEVQVADFCKKTRSGHIEPTFLHSHRHFKLSSGCPLGRPQVPQVSMQLGPARPRGHMPTAFHGGARTWLFFPECLHPWPVGVPPTQLGSRGVPRPCRWHVPPLLPPEATSKRAGALGEELCTAKAATVQKGGEGGVDPGRAALLRTGRNVRNPLLPAGAQPDSTNAFISRSEATPLLKRGVRQASLTPNSSHI